MIYIDTSVILAHVLGEEMRPPEALWRGDLVSSRLSEIEAWVRVHAYGKALTHGAALVETLARIDVIELDDASIARCRAPFPVPVRTLDAIHLATADFLRTRGFVPEIATYDGRMRDAAVALGFSLAPL